MDCAPLNLAHFHERRAEKLIKRHRFEDALKAIETSLLYVEDAYKNVKIPKALEVLNTQKWDYERKLNQIQMRRLQYEKMKSKEIVPSLQCSDVTGNGNKTDIVNPQSIARSIDKTVKEFNDKYGSVLLDKKELQAKENYDPKKGPKHIAANNYKKNDHLETNMRRLSIMGKQLQTTDDELPSLAPLELPSFDYGVFGVTSPELMKKFQN